MSKEEKSMHLLKTFGISAIVMVILAAPAFAQVETERRTARVELVGGISMPATTTTDFGGTPLDERIQGAGGDAATGGDAGAGAAGAAGGSGSGSGCGPR